MRMYMIYLSESKKRINRIWNCFT